jgi:hypothetical protein
MNNTSNSKNFKKFNQYQMNDKFQLLKKLLKIKQLSTAFI